jgi:protocatechuate 3,4-dioxygenase beta subunit
MHRTVLIVLFCLLTGCSDRLGGPGTEPVVGLPCEGCDGVFVGRPAQIDTEARIAPEGEPGEPMHLSGIVRDASGSAVPGVVVYAYHTDAAGLYPPDDRGAGRSHTHGRLRAWCRTDADGRYRFRTVRPGAYPDNSEPEHVHLHIIEPGRCTYYIDDVVFTGDTRLTESMHARFTQRGGSGVSTPVLDDQGVWQVTRDITLGLNIPGYPG